ncbi:hypothetical protein [Sulfurimonas sp.]|uniref:hypothetical protein n=1 Tax=Sulfurimonas sp. TaxID=2022749 RepID=UPI0025EE94AC|nr:hypothetical protein [Sulfurimonas sp.]MDD5158150.1 hypothetical protein [Sulfurimonas sp.]
MKFILFSLFTIFALSLQAEPYKMGQGVKVNEMLNIGGYFSTEFESNRSSDSVALEDIAVIAYGDLHPMLSYLVELESAGFYRKNLSDDSHSSDKNFHIERLYGDLWISNEVNIRFGKQIAPIGYWNREPINVLRDTTSNPLYSMLLFPRFLTGIDINGFIPKVDGVKYHLFGQNNNDLDENYINIPNTHFFGFALEKEISNELSSGISIGDFIPKSSVRSQFIQANFKYDNEVWQILAEGLVAKSRYSNTRDEYAFSAYMQGMYRYTQKHAVIGRYEYFNDNRTQYEDNILTLGYSYRPWYPVSLKAEYQFHSKNDENRALISFSVLF